MIRNLILSIAGLSAALVIAGFMGPVSRALDTLALVRPILGCFCILGVFAATTLLFRMVFGAIALVAITSVIVFFLPQDPGQDLRIYSKNLWFANTKIASVVADINAANVDAVLLQEVSDRNKIILDQLATTFPHQHLCRFSNWSGIAVVSRHPFEGAAICSDARAMAAAPIQINGTRVWLVSAHIPWPWPVDSAANEQAAKDLLDMLKAPIVIGGDFNAFPWTARVGTIAVQSGTQIAGPVRPTLYYRSIPLPIDLAMAPGGGSVERRPKLGSDHAGIVADLTLEPR